MDCERGVPVLIVFVLFVVYLLQLAQLLKSTLLNQQDNKHWSGPNHFNALSELFAFSSLSPH